MPKQLCSADVAAEVLVIYQTEAAGPTLPGMSVPRMIRRVLYAHRMEAPGWRTAGRRQALNW
jgi:hypothetical protein